MSVYSYQRDRGVDRCHVIPIQKSVGEVYVPSIQTKVLMVPPISGNFGIIQPNCMVGFVACLHYIFVFVVFLISC